jgi:hypothetical protein
LARVLPVAVVLVTFLLYRWTLLPEIDWSDAAELSLQAHQLGVTHPPGYPVHTVLGRLFIFILGDPARATNLLSAVSTAVAAGLLTATALEMTGNVITGALAALTFAAVPSIWDHAVTTEVYGVNALFVALSLFVLIRWHKKPSSRLLIVGATVFGISLGSYLANVLLLPAILFLLLMQKGDGRAKLARALSFLAVAALAGGVVLSWSFFRSPTVPPLGTQFIPDTPGRFALFLSGAQYRTIQLPSLGFYAARMKEHISIFARATIWGGAGLGFLGLWAQWRDRRTLAITLLIAFGVTMAYFTGYAATDYAHMVTPAYIVFSLWIAEGIGFLFRQTVTEKPERWIKTALAVGGTGAAAFALVADVVGLGEPGFGPAQAAMLIGGIALVVTAGVVRHGAWTALAGNNAGAIAATLVAVFVLAGQIWSQAPLRLARSQSLQVTDYVTASFETLPEDAVVAASWDKFAPLLYFQRVYGLRPDLTIVERTLEPEPSARTYAFDTVTDWHAYVAESSRARPVVIDTADASFAVEPLAHGWYRINP